MWHMNLISIFILLGLEEISGCWPNHQNYYLLSNRTITITNSNFPELLVTRAECIYYVKAPVNHFIEINCRYEMFPDECGSMFVLVSEDGDLKFRDADRFCRSGRFTKMSSFQYFALKLWFNDKTNSDRQKKLTITCEATAVARSEACDCGWCPPPDIDIKIGNGQDASNNEFPFLVAIQEIGSYGKIFCGGSIVSDRHIVTAAHCTKRQPLAKKLLALLGAHDLNSNTKSKYVRKHSIIRIINHPNHVGDYNDIALLLTRTSMEWSWGVAPICLPFLDTEDTFVYQHVEIAGWGSVKFSGPTSDILQKSNQIILENDRCNIFYNNTIEDNQLCTTDPKGQGMDSWQMDSGGPVILRQRERMFLVGIISYGRPPEQGISIGVNTRITSYLDWIQSHVQNPLCVR